MTDGTLYAGLYAYLSRHGDLISQGRQSSGGRTISQLFDLEPTPHTSGFDPTRPTSGNPWGNYTQAFAQQWDAITLQPHDRRHLTDVVNGREEGEVPSILEWMRSLSVNSPHGQVFLYSRPLRMGDTPKPFDYSREWVKDYVDTGSYPSRNYYSRSSVTQLMSKARGAQIEDSVGSQMPLLKLIPVGEVYYVLDQMIKAGQFEGTGITSLVQFYSDGSHPAYDLGSYAFALTFNASLSGDDPRGIAPNASYLPNGTLLSNTRIQTLIQEAVYQAMHFPGYAGWLNSAGDGIASPGSLRVNLLDQTDTPVSDAVVYLDLDSNGVATPDEPIARTDSRGVALLDGLKAGQHDLRLLDGLSVLNVDVVSGSLTKATLQSDARAQPNAVVPGMIRIRVFGDTNSDGQLNDDESVLVGDTVFIDLDRDGTLDVGERTATVDATGEAVFTELTPSNYTVGLLPSTRGSLTTFLHRDAWVQSGAQRDLEIGVAPRAAITIGVGTSNISGYVFNDLNVDYAHHVDEPPINGIAIWIDLDLDGEQDSSEPATTTDETGMYVFNEVPANTYVIYAVVPDGWTQTAPGANSGVAVTVGVGLSKEANPILIAEGIFDPPPLVIDSASISGRTYNDNNKNGVFDAGDSLISARTVYLDTNNNNKLDSDEARVLTDDKGGFTFGSLPAGTYRVRRVFPSGYTASNLPINLTLSAGQVYATADIGSVPAPFTPVPPPGPTTGSIAARVFEDLDASGDYSDSDFPIEGARVYVDLNDNAQFDTGEPFALADDQGGATLSGLAPGSVRIRVDAARYTSTMNGAVAAIAPGESTEVSFTLISIPVGAIRVTVYNDIDNDDQMTVADAVLSGFQIYLDQNDNGQRDSNELMAISDASGVTLFSAVPTGTYRVRAVLPSGYLASFILDPQQLDEGQTLELFLGVTVPPSDPMNGLIDGVTYNDNNANGIFDVGDLLITGKTVFLDANNNGKLDSGEKSTKSGSEGVFSFGGLAAGTYYVRRVFPAGFTYSNLPIDLSLGQGQAYSAANIGSVPTGTVVTPPDNNPPPPPPPTQHGSITGVLYNDNNANGIFDVGDTPISRVVYLDANNNGKLDSGEPNRTSGSDGAFTFANLSAGTHRVRRAFPSGYAASNAPRDYDLTAGQVVTGADIGSVRSGTVVTPPQANPPTPPYGNDTGSISGFLYWDTNRNGKYDAGESFQASKTVFIDLDNDNVLDSNETRLTTDSQGRFTFSGLLAGAYSVRRVVPKGYGVTTVSQVVNLTAGQIFSDVEIGTNTT